MRLQNIIYPVIFVSLLCSSTCKKNKYCTDGSHRDLYFINNSSKDINWARGDHYEDSIWRTQGITYPGADFGFISNNSTYKQGAGMNDCWESFFQSGGFHYFFLFDHDTVSTIGWQAINGTNRGLVKRIKVDMDYLQANNFAIVYP